MTSQNALDDLNNSLQRFAVEVPPILRRVKITEELAADVERSLTTADSPFTLAVVGQMRVGKSTFINSLVGAELAIPGVTETTATVNWFRHGTPEQCGRFRVVWNNSIGSSDEFDLAGKDRWLGNSELAARTRFLEFFSTADFLQKAHVVDTPGSRSTLTAHQEVSRGFLLNAGRAEHDSNFYGGTADCIIYVVPPVTRENDADMLGQFAAQRRVLQSTPFNSVAVLHKWETLQNDRPWNEAVQQAKRSFQALKTYVCDVIPVSGPLAWAAQRCEATFWSEVLRLICTSTADALETLTMKDSWFVRPITDCGLSAEERGWLQQNSLLPWPCFKTLLLFAASRSFANGEELKQAVYELSGIHRLLEFLESRFFERSRLIRASNLLNRALRAVDLARGRLRNRLGDLAAFQESGAIALAELPGTQFERAREFIKRQCGESEQESRQLLRNLRDIETREQAVRQDFQHFEADCASVHRLDAHGDQFTPAEVSEIMRLLGAYENLPEVNEENTQDQLHDDLDRWLILRHQACGERRLVLDQVVARLETALSRRAFTLPASDGGPE